MDGYGLGASLAATGVNTLLGVAGLDSQSEANRLNQQNFREQMRFARYQYEDTKKYNSMQEQVKRMRAAGLNPALASSALGAGMQGSVSQPSANPQQPLDLGGLASLGRGISTIGAELSNLHAQTKNLQSQSEKNEQETAGLQIDNLFRKENWKSLLYNRDTESWLKGQLADIAKLDLQFNKEAFKNRLLNLKYDTELKDAQVASQDIINHFLPSLQSAEYEELVARKVADYATGRASLQSAMAAIMNAKTEQGKAFAQFGKDNKERSNYFSSVMDLLFEQKRHYASQSYNQFLTAPIKLSAGLKGMSFSGAAPIGVKLGKKIADEYYR